jgi:hypothetical protein
MQNFDNNIVFWEKRQLFRRKLSKIAENCDHNIDPEYVWRGVLSLWYFSFNAPNIITCYLRLPKIITYYYLKLLPNIT